MRLYRKGLFWLLLLLLLLALAAGILLLARGLKEYDGMLHLPRREHTAILRCIWRRIVA